jgi:hypothetical protein
MLALEATGVLPVAAGGCELFTRLPGLACTPRAWGREVAPASGWGNSASETNIFGRETRGIRSAGGSVDLPIRIREGGTRVRSETTMTRSFA